MPEPIQHNLLEADKQEAVRLDGLPRAARYLTTYDDGNQAETQHVLYRPNGIVQSMPAADWLAQHGSLPTDPTPEQIAAALAAQAAAQQQAVADSALRRQRVLQAAQSAVGVRVNDLDSLQLKTMLACLLWLAGGLDKDLKVRPLNEWLERTPNDQLQRLR